MSTYAFGNNPFKMFQQPQLPKLNYEAMMSSFQKNLDAVCKAQQSVLDAVSVITEMQTNFSRHAIEETSNFMKNFLNAKTVEEKVHLQGEALKGGVDKVMSHGRKVAQHLTTAHKDISEHVGKSMNENLNHVKETMKTAGRKG